jgi:hypothetical protein
VQNPEQASLPIAAAISTLAISVTYSTPIRFVVSPITKTCGLGTLSEPLIALLATCADVPPVHSLVHWSLLTTFVPFAVSAWHRARYMTPMACFEPKKTPGEQRVTIACLDGLCRVVSASAFYVLSFFRFLLGPAIVGFRCLSRSERPPL